MKDVDILLDVDGVLNAVGRRSSWGWGGNQIRPINGFEIHYSDNMVTELNLLAREPYVHFHWLTTWLEDAPNILSPEIGLQGENWPVLDRPFQKFSDYSWWKLKAAEEHLFSTTHRVIWIDDDLSDPDAREFASNIGPAKNLLSAAETSFYGTPEYFVTSYGDRLLLVRPETSTGLTTQMFDLITDWIDTDTD